MRPQSLLGAALPLVVPVVLSAQGEIKPVQATPIEPYTAKTIEPYHATTSEPARTATTRRDSVRAADPKALVGTWQLHVEGTSYTTDDYATSTRTVTTSSGAKGRRLVIRANGTYDWGGHRGRWITTGEGADGYRIELLKADHGANWKLGWDTRRNAPAGRILVWDGNVWEVGTRR